jgi:hypothetical protein
MLLVYARPGWMSRKCPSGRWASRWAPSWHGPAVFGCRSRVLKGILGTVSVSKVPFEASAAARLLNKSTASLNVVKGPFEAWARRSRAYPAKRALPTARNKIPNVGHDQHNPPTNHNATEQPTTTSQPTRTTRTARKDHRCPFRTSDHAPKAPFAGGGGARPPPPAAASPAELTRQLGPKKIIQPVHWAECRRSCQGERAKVGAISAVTQRGRLPAPSNALNAPFRTLAVVKGHSRHRAGLLPEPNGLLFSARHGGKLRAGLSRSGACS